MASRTNTTENLRHLNRALVLDALREHGPEAHTGIARHSGLSSSTVSAITAELEEELIVRREEPKSGSVGRGRPRVLLGLNPHCACVATIRIAASLIEFSLVDYGGTLKDRFNVSRLTDDSDADSFSEIILAGLEKLISRSEINREKLYTISITTKGLVAENRPLLLWSPVLNDSQVDFESLLKKDWPARVLLNNETCFTAQAIADRQRRGVSAENVSSMARRHLVLSMEDSIGMGITTINANGKIESFAPPFGHITHGADGPLCRCGSLGCVEAYAGFYGILRNAFDVPSNTIPAKFIPHEEMNKIAERARKGDRKSAYAFRVAGDVLGAEISRLQSIFGLMPITITGPGAGYFDLMQEGFVKHLASNLLVKFSNLPTIDLVFDEAELIFEGNVQATLGHLDENIVATRQLGEQQQLA